MGTRLSRNEVLFSTHGSPSESLSDADTIGWLGGKPEPGAYKCALNKFTPVPLPAHIQLPNRNGARVILLALSSSEIDKFGSPLALAVHFGLRLLEDHSSLSGRVCFALGLQLPEDKDVARTTLLKERLGRTRKELTSLAE